MVLFDVYYLGLTVVQACREQHFHFASTLKSNRSLFKQGWKLKAGRYGRNLFRRRRTTSLVSAKPQGNACFHWVDAGWLAVSKLGNLHVVFSRKRTARKILGLVTDTPELSTAGLIQANEKRWAVEQFVKDTKQLRRSGLPALRCNGRLEEIHRILHRSQPSHLRLIDIDVEGVLQHRDNFDEVDRSGLQIVDEPRCWHNLLGLDIEDL
jgi:hypothetical protein